MRKWIIIILTLIIFPACSWARDCVIIFEDYGIIVDCDALPECREMVEELEERIVDLEHRIFKLEINNYDCIKVNPDEFLYWDYCNPIINEDKKGD